MLLKLGPYHDISGERKNIGNARDEDDIADEDEDEDEIGDEIEDEDVDVDEDADADGGDL